jgi:lipoprotein-anchoring transpeptidase ErfK/SrfK
MSRYLPRNLPRKIRAAVGGLVLISSLLAADLAMAGQALQPGAQNRFDVAGLFSQTGKVKLDRQFRRQLVRFDSDEAPGTIVVVTGKKFLYLVLGDGKAMRYGIGTARDGFEWSGTHRVSNKREWPGWTPPPEMRKRVPGLPAYMPGGIKNPLGARALYLGSTLYRIHGTNEPWSIGQDVSSGCIRMLNEDVEDLYDRVKIGAKVIVL